MSKNPTKRVGSDTVLNNNFANRSAGPLNSPVCSAFSKRNRKETEKMMASSSAGSRLLSRSVMRILMHRYTRIGSPLRATAVISGFVGSDTHQRKKPARADVLACRPCTGQ
jgi:hypothetical protein